MSRSKSAWSAVWSGRGSSSRLPPSNAWQQQLREQSSSSAPQQMDLGRHFYLNKILEQYAAKPASRTTLRQLVFFGRRLGQDRDKILKSANYVRQELAVRIAHRIRDLQALPYSVMNSKHLESVYEKYWSAFETFRKFPTIRTLEDNEEFCSTLKTLLDDHLTIIPSLTLGIVESSHHLPAEQLDGFMERMLRSRISRRVLAEQHIALSEALDDPFHFFNETSTSSTSEERDNDGEHVGIIYTSLKVSNVVEKSFKLLTRLFEEEIEAGIRTGDSAVLPKTVIDGALDARFAYIPEHLEYIMFELLKNSMMAVMKQPVSSRDPVCIRVTIVEGPPDEDLIIRISDCGGGLPTTIIPKVNSSRREHRRRLGHRVASRKRRELLEDEIAAVQSDKRESQTEIALDDDAPLYPLYEEVHDEGGFSEARPVMGMNQEAANATANKAGAPDPLIAAVTSFSNIRRRLEIEEKRLRKERQMKEKELTASENGETNAISAHESPGGEKEAIQMGLRAGLQHHEERASGIDSWVKLEALRNVGRFKGTVAEQIPLSRRKSSKKDQEESQQNQESLSPSSPTTHLNRAETGLGLPMTKIYTDFFGGSLSLRSLDGHGMDVFVRLPKLGTNKEAIEDIVL